MRGDTDLSVKLVTVADAQAMADEHQNGGCRKPHWIGGITINPCPCGRSAYMLCLACNDIVAQVFRGPCNHRLWSVEIREWTEVAS